MTLMFLQHFESVVIVGDGQLPPAVADAVRRLGRVHYLGCLEGHAFVDVFPSAAPSRKCPAPLLASESLATGRPFVLGPEVGRRERSAFPLVRAGEREDHGARLRAGRRRCKALGRVGTRAPVPLSPRIPMPRRS